MGFRKRLQKMAHDAGQHLRKGWGPKRRHQSATHDYRCRGFGHDYVIADVHDDGQRLNMYGWGGGIRSGDYLVMNHPNGGETRYQMREIEYKLDPADMWFAMAHFAPRRQGNSSP